MLSLIIPTYNEADNVEPLHERVRAALAGEEYEVVFVDDSVDDTPVRVARLAERDARVRLLHRSAGRGLSSAVVAGLRIARGDEIAVIDADLQHPPEVLVALLQALRSAQADVVVPSRYRPGGSPGGLSLPRRWLSLAGRAVAQALLSEARRTTDPMSGFFVARRAAADRLLGSSPRGFKILLELLVRGGPGLRLAELPYRFAPRRSGQSKLGWRTQVEYLAQLTDLVLQSGEDRRQIAGWLVAGAGVALNGAVLSLLLNVHFGGAYGSLLGVLFFPSHASMLIR